jgi:hypothetical protein
MGLTDPPSNLVRLERHPILGIGPITQHIIGLMHRDLRSFPRKPRSRLAVCLVVLSFLNFPATLTASSGTEGASFLDIPVGAGPAAMGSAYTALATDAYGPVYNPAGLGFLPDTQIAAQHLWYLESLHYEFLSIVHPLSIGKSLGVSAQYLGTGDITGTDTHGNAAGTYSSNYGAYSFTYGQKVGQKLSFGLTGKWIHAKLADVSGDAYAADIGSLYQQKDLRLALTVTNIGTKLAFTDQGDSLPLAVHLAGAFQPFKRWTLATEGVYSQTGLLSGRLGLEWVPSELIALRAGYKTETLDELSPIAGLTVGMGVRVWGQELAYAWLPYGDLGNTQYFSLLIQFGEAERAKRNLIQYNSIKSHRTAQEDQDPEYLQLMELLGNGKDPTAQIPEPQEDNR